MTESEATDKEREAFEAWAKKKKLLLDRSSMWPDRYSYCQTDDAWDGWRAALSSRDEATADAKRYRWLRATHWSDSELVVTTPTGVLVGSMTYALTKLDAAIDAAIASQRTSTEGKV